MSRLVEIASGYFLDLPPSRTTFGTESTCTIPFPAGSGIAPLHFQIMPVPGGEVLVDLSHGQPGLAVNGETVTQKHLVNGDTISVGNFQMRFESLTPVKPPPLPHIPPSAAPVSQSAVADEFGSGSAPMPPPTYTPYGVRSPRPDPYDSDRPAPGSTVRGRNDYEVLKPSKFINPDTVVQMMKWMLPFAGVIIFAMRLLYTCHKVDVEIDESKTIDAAQQVMETWVEAKKSGATMPPGMDLKRAISNLMRGVQGGPSNPLKRFQAPISQEEAIAIEKFLTWNDTEGIVFKDEHKEYTPVDWEAAEKWEIEEAERLFKKTEAEGR